jgi:hypothetical protein
VALEGASAWRNTDAEIFKFNFESIRGAGQSLESCLGRVFSFKSGCYGIMKAQNIMQIRTRPHTELKTRPRFCFNN